MGKGSVPQHEECRPDQPTLKEACRRIEEALEVFTRIIDNMQEYTEQRLSMNQSLIRLEHDARHPRLAMEVNDPANTKIRGRTEGVATAV